MYRVLSLPAIPAPAARPYFARIESLRGLGALAVAAYHFGGWTLHGSPLLPKAIHRLVPGHAALMVFFVISGFVLRVALQYGPSKVGPAVGKFIIARLFRVYPAVIVAVGVAALFPICQVTSSTHIMDRSNTILWLKNFALLDISANSTFWALQVEMLMVPVILAAWFLERRFGPRVVLALAFVATGLAFEPKWAVWPPLSMNCFAFLLGMAVPTIGRDLVWNWSQRRAAMHFVAATIFLLGIGLCFGLFSHLSALGEGYAAFVLVSIVIYRPDLSLTRFLEWKPLQKLGQAAGSLYMLHMATLVPTMMLATAIIPASWSESAPVLTGAGILTAWLLALAAIARIGFVTVEAPGIALGRRIIRALKLDSKRNEKTELNVETIRKAA